MNNSFMLDFPSLEVALVLFAAIGLLSYRELRSYLIDLEAVRIRAQAKPVIDRRIEYLAGRVELSELAAILAEDLTNRDTTGMVIDRKGRAIGTADPHQGPSAPLLGPLRYERTLQGDKHVTYVLPGPGGGKLLVVLIPPKAWLPTPPAVVQLTTELAPQERVLRRFVSTLVGGAVVIFGVDVAVSLLLEGPWELLSLAAIPFVVLAARHARHSREAGIGPAEELDDASDPGGSPARSDFVEVMRRVEAAQLATEASEAQMRRFVAEASHELRTPLTSLGASADVLESAAGRRPEDVRQVARLVRAQVGRMVRLVDDLLVLAELDAGQELKLKPVRLDRLVEEHAEELAMMAPDRRIVVDAGMGVMVECDHDRFYQILTNLTANAVRHTVAGGRVAMSARWEDGMAVVTVEDDGAGISADDLPHVFERFYRGSGSGSGLGLAIVKEIVEKHGGRVLATSGPAQGTIMQVELPPTRSANSDGR